MIPLIKSSFHEEKITKKALIDFIKQAKQFSMGEQCKRFEEAFAKKQERKHAVFVSSGSMANLILIQSLINRGTLKKGDRVGVSAVTWSTNVMPIIQLGLVPVVIDCDPSTLNVTTKQLKGVIKELDALFLTNVLGFSGDIGRIQKMCKREGVLLLEDNCESLGSRSGGILLGNFGLASTFSFFVGHHMSTIEGGMICTDDEDLYHMLVMTRAHGWDRNLHPKKQADLRKRGSVDDFYAKYTFYDLAYNGRPTEINGFIGNAQIKYLDKIVSARHKNFAHFNKLIQRNDDLIKFDLRHMDVISNFAVPIISSSKEATDKYKKRFIENDVEIRPIIAGDMTKQPFFQKYFDGGIYPNAALIHENGFYFGNNPELTKQEIALISRLLS